MKLDLKHGTKLKDASLEYRVALRLVSLRERLKKEVNIAELAKEIEANVPDVMRAIDLLSKDGHIEVHDFVPSTMWMGFYIDEKTRAALVKNASSYHAHLIARASRPAPKPPLPPIDPDVRKGCMQAARPLAAALLAKEQEHATWQIAGCIARIGLEKVDALVKAALAAEPTAEAGILRPFFDQYVLKRDEP
jgi:hypothetical protein